MRRQIVNQNVNSLKVQRIKQLACHLCRYGHRTRKGVSRKMRAAFDDFGRGPVTRRRRHKVAAQALPVVGALGGAAVNYAFIEHFQDVARGHFTVRRLERLYGKDKDPGWT